MSLKSVFGVAIALVSAGLIPVGALIPQRAIAASKSHLAQGLKDADSTALNGHNRHRSRHQAPAMTYDRNLAASAQAWSNLLAREGRLTHSSRRARNGAGENLYVVYTTGSESPDAVASQAIEAWYNEVKDYNYDRPGFSAATGHFTQVVWKSSTRLGCGVAQGRKTLQGRTYNAYYVTCHYGPAGNVRGQFPANVLPTGGAYRSASPSNTSSASTTSTSNNSSAISARRRPSGIGAFEEEVLLLTNQAREQAGVRPLAYDPLLGRIAEAHSSDMLRQDFFSHDSLDGSSYVDRMRRAGFTISGPTAENIAAGSSTPEQVVSRWLRSPGHRRNILNPALTHIGIGHAFAANDSGRVAYRHYWTQVFHGER